MLPFSSRLPAALYCLMLALCLLAQPVSAARAEKRVALVIGNGGYRNVTPLANPVNDARLVAETLKRLGFELVGGRALTDLTGKTEMEQAVQGFGQRIRGADVALFFYAGHGVQVDGANYLVPVGADVSAKSQIKYQLLDADFVLQEMAEAGTRVNLVVLDACRNNPFGDRGLRAVNAGLAQMTAPRGTLVAYSTAPGRTASDGTGANSPFSAALARHLLEPGQRIEDVFMRVGLDVEQKTGGEQSPWKSDNLRGVFCLAGACGQQVPAMAQPPASVPKPQAMRYPPTGESYVAAPGDPTWDLGLSKGRRASHEVLRDASVRTPQGRDSFRVDYDFPAGLTEYLAIVESSEKRDLSAFQGIEFSVKSSRPSTVYFTIVTSNTRERKIADRFYSVFHATEQWKTQRVSFRSMSPSIPWKQRLAALYGYTPGDGVIRPELTENLRIGLDAEKNLPGPGSLWVGDIRFYK